MFKLPTLLDGAMGTMLQKSGMAPGTIPETLNLTDPEKVAAVHRAYIRAGSHAVYANTFGANALKLKQTGYTPAEVIAAGIRIARECAAETGAMVGLDVGPLGVMLEPLGSLPFEDAVRLYAEIMRAGAENGADLIAIETMSDLAETRAALIAAREETDLPVFVTMSFDTTGRTFTGCTPASMARTMEGLGATAVGVNCSLGPKEMIPIVREIAENTRLPVIAKPNAGLPDPVTGEYGVDAEGFAAAMQELAAAGAEILGGCCGTDPDYIRALGNGMTQWAGTAGQRRGSVRTGAVCTGPVCLETDRVRVIGERINPTGKKRLQQALLEEDLDYLVNLAIQQQDAGADLLDLNVGYPGVDEVQMLPRAVKAIQAAVDLPLQLDTTNPAALEAALRVYNGKAAVNSVNGKEESLATVLPLVKKYGAAVVGLTLDESGIPDTAEKRVKIAEKILKRAEAIGIPREDVWIDCLVLTVSAQQEQAAETLRAVRLVTEELGLKTVLGVSNISFGLPNRLLITQTFLAAALEAGLTMPIVNPNLPEVMNVIAARRVLDGTDEGCRAYVERYAGTEEKKTTPGAEMSLQDAIRKGLRKEAGRLTAGAIETRGEMEIVEQELIPALEKTGEEYEQGKVFLPQLLSAAQAAQAAFEEIRGSLVKKGEKGTERGTVIMATVQGDIHDIGKNIVITVLENYGYRVTDMGKDVPPETIVREAEEKSVRLVGLSALMTTTLPAMAETVRQLKALKTPPLVMVGGAVVTADYARSIGADFYAKDVRDAVKITNSVFS